MAIDAKPFIKTLMDDGKMDKKAAEAKVAQIIAKVNEVMSAESEETKVNTIRIAIGKIVSGAKAEKYKGVCIAVGRKQDQNDFTRNKALEAYKQNSVAAVNNGLIAIINGKPVALDTRKFVDAAGTMENRQFGKPLPEVIQRNCYFLMDNKIQRVIGNIDVTIGVEYEVFGTMSKAGNISAVPKPAPISLGVVDPLSLWDQMVEAAQDSDLAVPLSEALDVKKNKYAIMMGTVKVIRQTGQNMMMVLDDEDTPDGVVGFSESEETAGIIGELDVGAEVVVLGRKSESTDKTNGQTRHAYNFLGIITNPASAKVVNALKDLDDVIYG